MYPPVVTQRAACQLTLRNLAQAARVQWSWSHTSSVLVGAAVAWADGSLSPWLLFWTWCGTELIHAGSCMTNDYWDHRSGADDVGPRTMFNAGSRVIQEGKIEPQLLHAISLVCYLLGAGIGVVLAMVRGWPILAIGFAGGLLAYFYTAPPLRLCYRGLDQLSLAFVYGPLTILGSYYVQAQRFSIETVLLSLAYGVSASMILYVKGFHDTDSDRRAGKTSIIIKLGSDRAVRLFPVFFGLAYAIVFGGALFRVLPGWTLVAAGSLPLAFCARAALLRHIEQPSVQTFFRTLMWTKSVHLYLALLFLAGYGLAGLLRVI